MKKHLFVIIIFFLTTNFSNIVKSEEIFAFCLIKNSDLKQSNLAEDDYSRFQGKVITYLISYDENLILDLSEDPEVSVITGMYGLEDAQSFEKNGYGINYKNSIEVEGDRKDELITYKYNNQINIINGKPTSLNANVDQTGFSLNNWKFQIDCRDREYSAEEISAAKAPSLKDCPKGFSKEMCKLMQSGKLIELLERNKIKRYSTYSLLIEEDYSTILFLLASTQKKQEGSIRGDVNEPVRAVTIINYDKFEFFEMVYNQKNNNGITFVQPDELRIKGDMESYMQSGYEVDNFSWSFRFRNDDQLIYSESTQFGNLINSYVASKKSFSISTLRPEVAWYAGTFSLVNNTKDLLKIYKINPITYCKLIDEEILKKGMSLEYQYSLKDYKDFNKRNNINFN